MNQIEQAEAVFVIFGSTGDLAKRKLFPSIYNLYRKGNLNEHFAVVGLGRREWGDEKLRTVVMESIQEELGGQSPEVTESFLKHFSYLSFDVTNKDSYSELNDKLHILDETFQIPGNRIFYMAMAPEFFGQIAQSIHNEGLKDTQGWTRLVIEKPFGTDLQSAIRLNDEIRQAFSEDEIYRIDHYLGKEMVQNIQVIRFANAIFGSLWNNRHIANIQVTSSEQLGVEGRGGYYEKSGALRDMVQNHMLQMVSLLAMDVPLRLSTDDIRSEKIKVLRALRPIVGESIKENVVRGQYGRGEINGQEVIGYLEEENVSDSSKTETYVAAKLMIDNHVWAGVPFYIRTGKRMAVKSTKIVVEFKELPLNLYSKENKQTGPNLLIIHIQPDEGMTIVLNGKKIGSADTTPVHLQYRHDSEDRFNTPEAYERLLFDCMMGDATNFAHWDEVSLSWSLVDAISKAWSESGEKLPTYRAGSMGPKEADKLLEADGFSWWPVEEM
ncbi:glucose-6-phosphate dehydrogenase [Shouchella clausii]|uniref:glucose-6-phosphate dehydrogenase n=1 Tax=Shouchella clausii TaxID=79880 RepID=UPI000B95EA9D|nr:glucose-6-phosphate dehydrogenase [Shouchella clausii]AST97857.1 glucose-6-phosphate dehydrogenase [Shouchella clausii]MCR1287517.1 glucose-6-phosphate dehydrogenase [Shouchella clausii]MEB5474126.1 glucose-6-phosphate dehydrogenase [Shouchella clausii]QNM44299.1 glucose-6-phosphate dehydrogenase [Shouchella clausii]WQG97010.1 glucose-6-phosphate dehydrogenase [Shouchella clausii]